MSLTRLALVLSVLALPLPLWAAVRYVSSSGSGSTCSLGSPCSLTTGLSQTQAGDTLYLRGGSYPGINGETNAPHSGTSWTNAITISAFPGETVTIDHGFTNGNGIGFNQARSYLIFDGINVDGGNPDTGSCTDGYSAQSGAHHIRFQHAEVKNCTVQGAASHKDRSVSPDTTDIQLIGLHVHHNGSSQRLYGHGIYTATPNVLVEGCEIDHNSSFGIQIYEDSCTNLGDNCSNGTVIRNNYIHDQINGYGGLVIGAGDGLAVYNNLIVNNNTGIDVGYGASHVSIYSNTIVGNTSRGIGGGAGVWVSANDVQAVDLKNNILYGNDTNLINDGSSTTGSNNLCNATGGFCTVSGNPGFVNAAGGNFHIAAAGSPAVNAGSTLGAPYNVDLEGTTRPAGEYTIGAYQYVGSPPPQPDPDGLYVALLANGSYADSSGQDNDAAAHGSMAANGPPIISGFTSFVFDGASYLTLPSFSASRPPSQFCISAWLNTTLADNWWVYDIKDGAAGYGLWIGSDGVMHGYAVTTAGFLAVPSSGVNVRDGTNHHVVFTKDATGGRVYDNGAQVGFTATTADLATLSSSAVPTIGRDSAAAQEFATGRMSHLRYYNFACTAAAVQNLYAEQVPAAGIELVHMAWYQANAAQGSQIGLTDTDLSQQAMTTPLGVRWAVRKNDAGSLTEFLIPQCRVDSGSGYGSWTTLSNSFGSFGLRYHTDTAVSTGTPTSALLPLGGYTGVAGVFLTNPIDTTVPYDAAQRVTVAQGQQVEVEARLDFGSPLTGSESVQCRVVRENGAALNSYGAGDVQIRTITLAAPPSGLVLTGGVHTGGTLR